MTMRLDHHKLILILEMNGPLSTDTLVCLLYIRFMKIQVIHCING